MEDGATITLNGDSTSRGQNPQRARASSASQQHKRSPSGGILSRLPFLRSNIEGRSPTSPTKKSIVKDRFEAGEEPLFLSPSRQPHSREMEPSMAAALRQHKSRKRKGSLRKAALLSTGRLKFERRPSEELERGEPTKYSMKTAHEPKETTSPSDIDSSGTHYDASASSSAATISEPSNWSLPPSSQVLKLDTITQANGGLSPPAGAQDLNLLSPESITSPISRYASTTSDEDGGSGIHLSIGASAAELTRRRSTLRNPILPSPARSPSIPPPHSAADTEYWGWIILFVTWIVFVVGMGSCLGVWSWAWDVGETPYAPPELEDDPTLPIVGYYPALIVCTGVMAWVWCLVAWIGMKYFRHARFDAGGGSDEGD
ncbi:uncharacterized protein PV09_00961 [Verruconis gallopava]|uniref:Uncharacterized protein n=1 Tax=Verruconis gallopava TaxID=253628 RepID=A0A0D1XZ29_9PEZI|nr:uncharacterized protein PV09_00961 [Verruconis gallopava]KIW08016.1 hypothetical protein PV09_00961 [Verruconis gallopava]